MRTISRKDLRINFMINLKKIPDQIGYYIAGFTDGEGSFNVVFRPRKEFSTGWKISLCFNVSQKDKVILTLLKRYLQCGTLRQRKDGIWYYEVNNIESIRNNIIPFFNKFHFLSAKKKRDFSKFKQILNIIIEKKHTTKQGMKEIILIRKDMNDGGKRKYFCQPSER